MNMRKDRLLKLADFLETIPRKKFDIGGWGFETEKCGFAGCAMGWAARSKMFRGLTFDRGNLEYTKTPDANGDGFVIAENLFGIDSCDVRSLFTWRGYKATYEATPKQVSRRIRKFVADPNKAMAPI